MPQETAVDLRFAPRKVPLEVGALLYVPCFHCINPIMASLVIAVAVLSQMEDWDKIVYREFSNDWKIIGSGNVIAVEHDFKDLPVFYKIKFRFTDPKQNKEYAAECGTVFKTFIIGKEYPVEKIETVNDSDVRLSRSFSIMFFCFFSVCLLFFTIFLSGMIPFYFAWRHGNKQLALCRSGVAAAGRVIGTEPVFLLTRILSLVNVFVEFQDENGNTFTVKDKRVKLPVEKVYEKPPVLFYDADNPLRVLFMRQFGQKAEYDFTGRVIRMPKGAKYAMYFTLLCTVAVIVCFIGIFFRWR